MSGPLPPSGDDQAVLRARARRLAQPPVPETAAAGWLEVLEFRLADERYAVETRHVREVQPLRSLTALPGTPDFVLGIVQLRGRVVPVLDLKKFFGLPQRGLTDLHRIVLVRDASQEFGILADISVGVRRIALDALQAALPTLDGVGAAYVRGVTPERLVVLDMERIFADPRIVVDDEADNRK